MSSAAWADAASRVRATIRERIVRIIAFSIAGGVADEDYLGRSRAINSWGHSPEPWGILMPFSPAQVHEKHPVAAADGEPAVRTEGQHRGRPRVLPGQLRAA